MRSDIKRCSLKECIRVVPRIYRCAILKCRYALNVNKTLGQYPLETCANLSHVITLGWSVWVNNYSAIKDKKS